MLKSLISLAVVTSSFTVTPVLTNIQNINNINHKNIDSQSTENIVKKEIIIDNNEKNANKFNANLLSNNEDLQFDGPNSNILNRVFISSNKDKNLPKTTQKTNDYLIGKGKKGYWYNHLINGLSINVKDYAANKTEFIKKYKTITFSYAYMYVLWNDKQGSTNPLNKNAPLIGGTTTYILDAKNHDNETIFNKSEPSHANKEHIKLSIWQKWDGDILTYKFWLSVWYTWQWNSTHHHSVVASFTGDQYTFSSIPKNQYDKPTKIENLETNSFLTPNPYPGEIETNTIDTEIKRKSLEPVIKDAWFKESIIAIQYFTGSIKVGNTTYVYSFIFRWGPQSFYNKDSTLLLNGINLKRSLTTICLNNQLKVNYENDFGDKEEKNYNLPDLNLFNLKLQGKFLLPFVYIQ